MRTLGELERAAACEMAENVRRHAEEEMQREEEVRQAASKIAKLIAMHLSVRCDVAMNDLDVATTKTELKGMLHFILRVPGHLDILGKVPYTEGQGYGELSFYVQGAHYEDLGCALVRAKETYETLEADRARCEALDQNLRDQREAAGRAEDAEFADLVAALKADPKLRTILTILILAREGRDQ